MSMPVPHPDGIKEQYDSIKNKSDAWNVVEALNQLYKIDRVLLRHAFDNYEGSKKMGEYKNVQKFYRHLLDNLPRIEDSYLQEGQEDSTETTTFQKNKSNTSKFIHDEREHYESVLQGAVQELKHEEGINGPRLFDFVRDLFASRHTQVMLQGREYFQDQNTQEQFKKVVRDYAAKGHQEQAEQQCLLENFWLGQQQILDFLTHWIAYYQNRQLHILYSRTPARLTQMVDDLIRSQEQISPSEADKQEGIARPEQVSGYFNGDSLEGIQEDQNLKEFQNIKNVGDINKQIRQQIALQRLKKSQTQQAESKSCQKKLKAKIVTKRQNLIGRIPELFMFGCKRRYPLPKGTTFDQIQSELKTMNLEKFMNFCTYFGVSEIVSRDLLAEMFKNHALNRLTIDEKRFAKIIQSLVAMEEHVADRLLEKKQYRKKFKSQDKLSSYKYSLRPVHGKSVQVLQRQIEETKKDKQKIRNEKIMLYLQKKLNKLEVKKPALKAKDKSVLSSKVIPQSTNLFDLQLIRDDLFDPESFISHDEDELLNLFEIKKAKRVSQVSPMSSLQSILSKRLQNGDKVLKKMSQQGLSLYK